MNAALVDAITAFERATAEEDRAWDAFNRALAGANAAVGGGQFFSWAGEHAVRWIPTGADPSRLDAGETFIVGGVGLLDEAREDLPATVREVADSFALSELISACDRAATEWNRAGATLAAATPRTPSETLAKCGAILGSETWRADVLPPLIEAATQEIDRFSAEFDSDAGRPTSIDQLPI